MRAFVFDRYKQPLHEADVPEPAAHRRRPAHSGENFAAASQGQALSGAGWMDRLWRNGASGPSQRALSKGS